MSIQRSYYVLACECGAQIKTDERGGICPACGAIFELQWGEQDQARLDRMKMMVRKPKDSK